MKNSVRKVTNNYERNLDIFNNYFLQRYKGGGNQYFWVYKSGVFLYSDTKEHTIYPWRK